VALRSEPECQEFDRWRAVILSSCVDENSAVTGVHINRLKRLSELYGCADDQSYVEKLIDLGEVIVGDRGFYFPTPFKLVELQNYHLLVASTSVEDLGIQMGISFHSGARLVKKEAATLRVTSLTEWLKIPTIGSEWVDELFRYIDLEPYFPCDVTTDQLEVYAPMCSNAPFSQPRRWVPLAEVSAQNLEKPVVARTKFGVVDFYEYKFVVWRSQNLLQSSVKLSIDFLRRLIFALDARYAQNKNILKVIRSEPLSEYTLLRQRLPDPETRFVRVFGEVAETTEKFKYVYRVHNYVRNDFEGLLMNLGIVTED
jgi:hypothetical protein